MNVSPRALRELHGIHRRLRQFRERLERGPQQTRAADANVKRLEGELEQGKTALTQSRVASDEKQLQLKERESRIADLRRKLNECSSNREYQALREQIAADEQANGVLADEILEALDKIDQQQQALAALEASLTKAKQERDRTRQRVTQEQHGLEEELGRASDDLRKAEAALPAEFKRDFLRLTKALGEDALAEVDGESCGHCNQMLTPQMLNELHMGRPLFCKSCGCLLYVVGDAGNG